MSTSRDGAFPKEPATPAQPAPAVRFDAVWLRRRDETPVLKGVSFALAPGSCHLLTGPPGSGKTSLMRLICLAERPSQGLAQVFGRDIATLTRKDATLMRRRIGSALQPSVFADHMTVWDNAALTPRVVGRPRADYAGEIDAVLKWMGLGRLADAWPRMLSPAEQYRLTLARAIVNRPELLLADAPPDGLDTAEVQRVSKLIGEIHKAGATVLMATRDAAMADAYPTLRLAEGRVSMSEQDPS